MILSVTGHRPNKLGGYGLTARKKLDLLAEACLDQLKPDKVLTGMALGWDQSIARACITLGIPFVAYVPFAGQEKAWPPASQSEYKYLLSKASEIIIVSDGEYSPEKMQIRNQALVDNSTELLALWNGDTYGGTYNCLKYALGKVNMHNAWKKFEEMK